MLCAGVQAIAAATGNVNVFITTITILNSLQICVNGNVVLATTTAQAQVHPLFCFCDSSTSHTPSGTRDHHALLTLHAPFCLACVLSRLRSATCQSGLAFLVMPVCLGTAGSDVWCNRSRNRRCQSIFNIKAAAVNFRQYSISFADQLTRCHTGDLSARGQ